MRADSSFTNKSMKEVEKAIEKAGLEIAKICKRNNINYLDVTFIDGCLMFNNDYWKKGHSRLEYHKKLTEE